MAEGLISVFTYAQAQHVQTLEFWNPLKYPELLGASKVLVVSPLRFFSFTYQDFEKKLQSGVQGDT